MGVEDGSGMSAISARRKSPPAVVLIGAAVLLAGIGGVWLGTGNGSDDASQPKSGPVDATSSAPTNGGLGPGCMGPEVRAVGGSPQFTWTGVVGTKATVGGQFKVVVTDGSKVHTIELIVGQQDASGSPMGLDAGQGVLESKELAMVNGTAPSGQLTFTPDRSGRYPVWALVTYATCDGGEGIAADPVGFVVAR